MRSKLKNGLEVDAIYGRRLYCYLKNRPKIVKFAKRCINKRIRKDGKSQIRKNLEDENE